MNLNLPESLFGGGLVLPYRNFIPKIGDNVFIAPHATAIGQVTLGNQVSIWFGTTLRGDIAAIEVGEGSNIQDHCILHVGRRDPCIVGANVTVGHGAILHGCMIGDDCLIGMGATLINGSIVGRGAMIGAGALVTQGMEIPPHHLALGSPAKVTRELTDEERERHTAFAKDYIHVAENYRSNFNTE